MSIKVVEIEHTYERRRTYHTGHSRAEEARQRQEMKLEQLRRGEQERQKLLAQARWLSRSQDATDQIRVVLTRVMSASAPERDEECIEWNRQIMVLLEGIECEIKRREAERLLEEERLRKEREERDRLEAERIRLEWEAEREYHRELLQQAERALLTRELGEFSIYELYDIAEWKLLPKEKLEVLKRLIHAPERRARLFQELLEAHEDHADKLPKWRGGNRAFEDKMINLRYNRSSYRKRHRKGYDPDQRRAWRQELRKLHTA